MRKLTQKLLHRKSYFNGLAKIHDNNIIKRAFYVAYLILRLFFLNVCIGPLEETCFRLGQTCVRIGRISGGQTCNGANWPDTGK